MKDIRTGWMRFLENATTGIESENLQRYEGVMEEENVDVASSDVMEEEETVESSESGFFSPEDVETARLPDGPPQYFQEEDEEILDEESGVSGIQGMGDGNELQDVLGRSTYSRQTVEHCKAKRGKYWGEGNYKI